MPSFFAPFRRRCFLCDMVITVTKQSYTLPIKRKKESFKDSTLFNVYEILIINSIIAVLLYSILKSYFVCDRVKVITKQSHILVIINNWDYNIYWSWNKLSRIYVVAFTPLHIKNRATITPIKTIFILKLLPDKYGWEKRSNKAISDL